MGSNPIPSASNKVQKKDFSRLKRPLHAMPDFVQQALVEKQLMDAYRSRPPYQQNDYLSWITRAKLDFTRQKRLGIMLQELERGTGYMKMPWHPVKTKHGQPEER